LIGTFAIDACDLAARYALRGNDAVRLATTLSVDTYGSRGNLRPGTRRGRQQLMMTSYASCELALPPSVTVPAVKFLR
jgi:hypothetical protein